VEWLGEVPGHWEVVRLKNVLQSRITDGPHTTPVFTNEGVPFLSVDGIQEGELQFDGCRYISDEDHSEFRKKASPKRDDLLMGKAASTGKIARVKVDFEFSIWSPLALIRVDRAMSNPAFYEQSLKSPILQAQIDNFCTANTQKNISMDDIPKLILTRPPLDEQTQIAAFLDRETAKIDELVAEQRRLMALLKEKRQAVISHAVTRGLNPHAPLKPSDIEWLGDVPEHWRVMPMRMISNVVRGASPRPAGDPRFFGGGYMPWVTVGEITKHDAVYLTETEFFLTQEGATHSNLFRSGTLIYSNSGATLGVPKILNIDACANDGVVAFLNLDGQVQPEFLYHYLASITESIREKVKQGSGQPNLNTDIVKDLRFGVPPLDEQTQIVARISELANQFGSLTTEAQRAIDLLQERRAALISAAVTGQIDVRGTVVT